MRHRDFLVLLVSSCVLVMITQCLIPVKSRAGIRDVEPHGFTAVAPIRTSAEPAEAALLRQGFGGYPLRIPPRLDSRGFLPRRVSAGITLTSGPTLSTRDDVTMWGKAELAASVVNLRPKTLRFGQEVSTNEVSGRASANQVGTIMAILAVFQDADVLPPESSPDANRLIKALIQFQSAFMKSPDPAVRRLLEDALEEELGEQAPAAVEAFRADGWTSQSLEALVDYTVSKPNWAQPDLIQGLRAYNIGPEDFELLARTFTRARMQLAAQGKNFHSEYAVRRLQMPGARK